MTLRYINLLLTLTLTPILRDVRPTSQGLHIARAALLASGFIGVVSISSSNTSRH